jgi:hypothetical protein
VELSDTLLDSSTRCDAELHDRMQSFGAVIAVPKFVRLAAGGNRIRTIGTA